MLHYLLQFYKYALNCINMPRIRRTDYSIGGYATYFFSSDAYIDGVLKANRFKHDVNITMTNGGKAQADYYLNGIGAAIEGGYHYLFDNNLFVEPYARGVFYIGDGKKVTLDNGLEAKTGNDRSVRLEVGASVGKTYTLSSGKTIQPYLKVAFEREMVNANHVTINNQHRFNNAFQGNLGRYGVGLDSRVGKDLTIYAEVDYQNGQYIESPVMANIGLRYNF